MFGTVLGALPRPQTSDDLDRSDDALVRVVIALQEEVGLEPVTDGRLRWPNELGPLQDLAGIDRDAAGILRISSLPTRTGPLFLDEWRFAASVTRRAVKQALPGPYTVARWIDGGGIARDDLTLALAEALNAEIADLAAAGCPLIEIDEPDATAIGTDHSERELFVQAHRHLTAGLSGAHLSLALTGGDADTAGIDTFIDAPYASYAVDLINGPDNWRLVTAIPGERGIVCGALDARARSDDTVELLAWAAHYAASTNGRGLDRVGLAVVPGLDRQDWPVVERKLAVLGRATAVAGRSGDELAASIDPRAVDIRSAALGRFDPAARRSGPMRARAKPRRGRR
jgi:methionine synthase II (cobalamin-independent)